MAPDDKHDLISGTCSHLPYLFPIREYHRAGRLAALPLRPAFATLGCRLAVPARLGPCPLGGFAGRFALTSTLACALTCTLRTGLAVTRAFLELRAHRFAIAGLAAISAGRWGIGCTGLAAGGLVARPVAALMGDGTVAVNAGLRPLLRLRSALASPRPSGGTRQSGPLPMRWPCPSPAGLRGSSASRPDRDSAAAPCAGDGDAPLSPRTRPRPGGSPC